MRIQYRGGVWKNSEDEILKAAVMKYGMNQWARIASLLGRKSATQCKARWYEWLDPAIKKTPWTRVEEDKLLHLVKVMPTSWRTIAPMIGRTAAQCIEHYEILIDQVRQGHQQNPTDDAAPTTASAASRSADADTVPESKHARPDPVDMDENELEMLSEARARLANTKGKKAKRKAREKQLEVAKRLALLQKRHELKMAGIDVKLSRRKKNVTDYATEIPFERAPAAGFYDITEENDRLLAQSDKKVQIGKLLQKYKGKTESEKEAEAQKHDKAKRKQLEKVNLPAALGLNRVTAPRSPVLKKARLSLPTPQLSDIELERLSKSRNGLLRISNGHKQHTPGRPPTLNGQSAQLTNASTYSLQTPNSERHTPEPWAIARRKKVQTLLSLKSAGTPLRGGSNPDVPELGLGGRVTPALTDLRTPNPLATPLSRPGSAHGSSEPIEAKGKRANLSEFIKSKLQSLPEPENEYDIDVETDVESADQSTDNSGDAGDDFIEDAEDEARRRKNENSSLFESEKERLMSSAAKQELPTPSPVPDGDKPAKEMNFIIERDRKLRSLLEEEKENGGLMSVSMLHRLQELTSSDTVSDKYMNRAVDLVNEQIAQDGPAGFALQDELMEALKSERVTENDGGILPVMEDVSIPEEEEERRNELKERERVLWEVYDKYKKVKDLEKEDKERLKTRIEKGIEISSEAKAAKDEESILKLITKLKTKLAEQQVAI